MKKESLHAPNKQFSFIENCSVECLFKGLLHW